MRNSFEMKDGIVVEMSLMRDQAISSWSSNISARSVFVSLEVLKNFTEGLYTNKIVGSQ
jgi:hypothetical protein